jgi:predicted choloylglycine hydrolase
MLRTRLALFILVLPVVAAWADPKPPFHYTEGKYGKGELKIINSLPVLTVEGTPVEMGEAVGKLALAPGKRAMEYPHELLRHIGADRLWDVAVTLGKGMYRTQFPANAKDELESMSKAAGVGMESIIAANTMFDLKGAIACSAILVEPGKSQTGGPLLARNLDYPSLGYIHNHTLVTVYKPKDKHAFVTIGFPGLYGCLSGMNDAGLALAVLEVIQVKPGERSFNAEGVPYAINYRQLLEECTTIDEAFKALSTKKRVCLNNLVVADKNGVAVFEISPDKVVKRTATNGLGICTNHFCDVAMKVEDPENVAYTLDRFNTLQRLRKMDGKLGLEDLHKQLDEANLGELTLQTMIFEPATLKLHLAVGQIPASGGPMRTLELKELFGKK